MDINGKIAWQQIVNPDEAVAVGHLPQGLYIVRVAGKMTKMLKR